MYAKPERESAGMRRSRWDGSTQFIYDVLGAGDGTLFVGGKGCPKGKEI